ncbi:MAG: HNH endonuclease, partial [Gammaproteobacteria bacterium]
MRGGKGSTGLYASNDRIGYLHRWVAERKGLDMAGGREIDHVNGDRLDNRRANLRLAQRSQNMANGPARLRTSQYRGVSWRRRGKAWQAHIMVNRGNHFLGLYESETDAARAYDLAAVAAFGEYARPNLPELINEPAPMRRMR